METKVTLVMKSMVQDLKYVSDTNEIDMRVKALYKMIEAYVPKDMWISDDEIKELYK